MKNIRPKIIPVLLESQVLTEWWWEKHQCLVFTDVKVLSALREL